MKVFGALNLGFSGGVGFVYWAEGFWLQVWGLQGVRVLDEFGGLECVI